MSKEEAAPLFSSLSTLNDCAALLTPVAGDIAFAASELLEVVALGAGVFETFRAVTVAKFLFGDGQMAAPATKCFLPLRQ